MDHCFSCYYTSWFRFFKPKNAGKSIFSEKIIYFLMLFFRNCPFFPEKRSRGGNRRTARSVVVSVQIAGAENIVFI